MSSVLYSMFRLEDLNTIYLRVFQPDQFQLLDQVFQLCLGCQLYMTLLFLHKHTDFANPPPQIPKSNSKIMEN